MTTVAHLGKYRELEPCDALLAAIVKQAIRDFTRGAPRQRAAARVYLEQLGLLDEAGKVVSPCEADMGLLWPETT